MTVSAVQFDVDDDSDQPDGRVLLGQIICIRTRRAADWVDGPISPPADH